jgi:DnaJ-class molecular chaperone
MRIKIYGESRNIHGDILEVCDGCLGSGWGGATDRETGMWEWDRNTKCTDCDGDAVHSENPEDVTVIDDE